jgi:hypothetical protein
LGLPRKVISVDSEQRVIHLTIAQPINSGHKSMNWLSGLIGQDSQEEQRIRRRSNTLRVVGASSPGGITVSWVVRNDLTGNDRIETCFHKSWRHRPERRIVSGHSRRNLDLFECCTVNRWDFR